MIPPTSTTTMIGMTDGKDWLKDDYDDNQITEGKEESNRDEDGTPRNETATIVWECQKEHVDQ